MIRPLSILKVLTKGQVDTALAGKANSSHTHAIAEVTNLQTTLSGKEPTIAAGTSSDYYRGDKSWQPLNKTAVGLGGVDNTSDANKPVSSATQTALDAKVNTSSLATVATTGSYNDLTNKPTIPTVSDATTGSKGIVQLAGDLAGTAAAPTVPGLTNKANTSTTITGANSISGGGDLSANRTLALVNDNATPGTTKY